MWVFKEGVFFYVQLDDAFGNHVRKRWNICSQDFRRQFQTQCGRVSTRRLDVKQVVVSEFMN